MTRLALRPGINDHLVLADVLTEIGAGPSWAPDAIIGEIVVDATTAQTNSRVTQVATEFGLPLVVDPMTVFMATPVDPKNAWSRLPYATAAPASPDEIGDLLNNGSLVEQVIEMQLRAEASAIVPPYFHSSEPKDPWQSLTLRAMSETRLVLDRLGVNLPLRPVLSGRIDRYTPPNSWTLGVREFAQHAQLVGAESVAIQLGPIGDGNDNLAKVIAYAETLEVVASHHLDVVPLRQGALSPLLAALGVSAFETGISYGDHTNVSQLVSSRKPKRDPERRGGMPAREFAAPLNRFVSRDAAAALAANRSTHALVACEDTVFCCPNGLAATPSERGSHAVRSRLRLLSRLNAAPVQSGMRLVVAEQMARSFVDRTRAANKVLELAGEKPLPVRGAESLVAALRTLADRARDAA